MMEFLDPVDPLPDVARDAPCGIRVEAWRLRRPPSLSLP